jgi:T5SS/PEP-CTERM-associated repeat protein
VAGAGTTWTNNSTTVGGSGTGTLTILDNSSVSDVVSFIGNNAGSTGTVTVAEASTWTSTILMLVGGAGTGTLNVATGGLVISGNGTLGGNAGSSGTATLTGSSFWVIGTDLRVGSSGSGTLNILSGSTVNSGNTTIAENAGATGRMTVDGAGSALTYAGGLLRVGAGGNGSLTLQNSGVATGESAQIGAAAGSTGTVTVNGVGSVWTNTNTISVGEAGNGTLNLLNGGAVTNATSVIAGQAGSTGTATVSGPGSTWTTTGVFFVGPSGNGTVNILNGGTITSAISGIGVNAFSFGHVTVDGPGSRWNISNTLEVARNGTGSLTVQNGGAVTVSPPIFIAANAGSSGAVTVTGTSSTLATGSTSVGTSGMGALSILNGGTVVDTVGIVAHNAGSVGTATVSGAGSRWTSTSGSTVGFSGNGALTITGGGTVTTGSAQIGLNAGSTGQVKVAGNGSTWTTNDLVVGDRGNGTLTIRDGGAVNSTFLILGTFPGGTGTLNIGAAAGAAAAAPGSLNASELVFGNGTGQIVFNHTGTNYAFTPTVSGLGTVRVESGSTNLTAINTYTGNTIVNGGTLLVNGSIASSALTTVNAGGTLGGTGFVGNTSISGGTLSPGNSVGAITIQGNLVLTAASTYMVEVSASGADRTNVTGTATLGGARVAVNFDGGSNQRYTILNAAGGVTGTFGSVAANNNVIATLSYDANDVFLNFESTLGAGTWLNPNQQAVAAAINTAFNTGSLLPTGFGSVFSLTGTNLANALSQLTGEAATGTQQTTFDAMDKFISVMTDPFMGSRAGGAPEVGATGYADENAALANAAMRKGRIPAEQDPYAAMARKAPPLAVFAQRWSVWGRGLWRHAVVRRQRRCRLERRHRTHLWRRGGLRLSSFTGHSDRLRARRRRHQIRSRERARRRTLRDVPGRHLRQALYGSCVSRRSPCLWLAGYHRRPHCPSEQLSRQLRRECALGPARGGLSLRIRLGRPHAICGWTVHDLLPARVCRADGGRHQHLRPLLCREGRHRVTHRARPARRHVDCHARCDRHATRSRGLGAQLQHRPQHQCDLPDAACVGLRRQRSGTGT